MMSDAQLNYAACSGVVQLKESQARERNKDLYDELDRVSRDGSDDDIHQVMKKISLQNKNLGLYKARDELHESEDRLISWGRDIIQEIKTAGMDGALCDEVLLLFDDSKLSRVARLIFRDKLVSLLMKIEY